VNYFKIRLELEKLISPYITEFARKKKVPPPKFEFVLSMWYPEREMFDPCAIFSTSDKIITFSTSYISLYFSVVKDFHSRSGAIDWLRSTVGHEFAHYLQDLEGKLASAETMTEEEISLIEKEADRRGCELAGISLERYEQLSKEISE